MIAEKKGVALFIRAPAIPENAPELASGFFIAPKLWQNTAVRRTRK
jgi:hypothetical protein